MKLLFDQNVSPKLVNRLADLFPGSSHVQSVGLDCASDDQVWEHARLNGFALVTKDADCNNLSVRTTNRKRKPRNTRKKPEKRKNGFARGAQDTAKTGRELTTNHTARLR